MENIAVPGGWGWEYGATTKVLQESVWRGDGAVLYPEYGGGYMNLHKYWHSYACASKEWKINAN